MDSLLALAASAWAKWARAARSGLEPGLALSQLAALAASQALTSCRLATLTMRYSMAVLATVRSPPPGFPMTGIKLVSNCIGQAPFVAHSCMTVYIS